MCEREREREKERERADQGERLSKAVFVVAAEVVAVAMVMVTVVVVVAVVVVVVLLVYAMYLEQEVGTLDLVSLLLETLNKHAADDLALLLRLRNTLERVKELRIGLGDGIGERISGWQQQQQQQ